MEIGGKIHNIMNSMLFEGFLIACTSKATLNLIICLSMFYDCSNWIRFEHVMMSIILINISKLMNLVLYRISCFQIYFLGAC